MHRLIMGSDHRERNERIDFAGYSSRSALLPLSVDPPSSGTGMAFPVGGGPCFLRSALCGCILPDQAARIRCRVALGGQPVHNVSMIVHRSCLSVRRYQTPERKIKQRGARS